MAKKKIFYIIEGKDKLGFVSYDSSKKYTQNISEALCFKEKDHAEDISKLYDNTIVKKITIILE